MLFAECFFWALSKEALCRVLNKKHSAKKNTWQRSCFAECKKILGKDILCRVPKKHSAKKLVYRVPKKHSTKKVFAECFFFALDKAIFQSTF
jgi:hypothetical protein